MFLLSFPLLDTTICVCIHTENEQFCVNDVKMYYHVYVYMCSYIFLLHMLFLKECHDWYTYIVCHRYCHLWIFNTFYPMKKVNVVSEIHRTILTVIEKNQFHQNFVLWRKHKIVLRKIVIDLFFLSWQAKCTIPHTFSYLIHFYSLTTHQEKHKSFIYISLIYFTLRKNG